MQAVIVDDHLLIQPQAAAVVGGKIQRIDTICGSFQKPFEHQSRIFFPGKSLRETPVDEPSPAGVRPPNSLMECNPATGPS